MSNENLLPEMFAMRRRGILFAVVALTVSASAGSSAVACLRVPQSIPTNRLVTSGTKLTVPVGAIVWDVLVEAEVYMTNGAPQSFPWAAPKSSNPEVLRPVRVCKVTGPSSLPDEVFAFRARRRGTARLVAPVTPQWQSVKLKPPPSINRITVR